MMLEIQLQSVDEIKNELISVGGRTPKKKYFKYLIDV